MSELCKVCGTHISEDDTDTCSQHRAMTTPTGCNYVEISSRICERGTQCCTVQHSTPTAREIAKQIVEDAAWGSAPPFAAERIEALVELARAVDALHEYQSGVDRDFALGLRERTLEVYKALSRVKELVPEL